MIFNIFAFIFIFAVPSALAYKEQYKAAGLVCVFTVVFLLSMAVYKGKVAVFEFWGMKAELKEVIEEATVKIEQMKTVALATAEPIYDSCAYNFITFGGHVSGKPNYQMKNDLDEALRSIDISEEEINEISWSCKVYLGHGILKKIPQLADYESAIVIEFFCPYYRQRELVEPSSLRRFLDKKNLLSDKVEDVLEDYEVFYSGGIPDLDGRYVGAPKCAGK